MPISQGDYDAALRYLFSATDYERMRRVRYNADTFSLDRMRRLLVGMWSPHRRLRAVHVAGTKGKGSTAAMVHAVAQAGGLRVGLYTSPHLVDIRERIRVGAHPIPREDLAERIAGARPHVERLRGEGDAPTFFEIFTALAFDHFARVGVDLAVAEVGLGGRLDATNVLEPEVAVLTAVSLDHTAQLGDTLGAIAAEKAGIIKAGVPVVCQPQPSEAAAVIEQTCRQANARLVRIGADVTYEWAPAEDKGRPGGRLTVRTSARTYAGVFLPLMGEHQAVNAATALAAAERVPLLAERLTLEVARAGLRAVDWPGRMEFVPGAPATVLDGAHNRASMERLAEALASHFPGRRVAAVFGAAADKDVDGMLDVVAERLPKAAVVFTKTENPRAAEPADLASRYRKVTGKEATAAPGLAEALETARDAAGSDGLVVVCGSLYLVGAVKGHLESRVSD